VRKVVLLGEKGKKEGDPLTFVNSTSVAAWEGQLGQSPYSASKGGVASLSLPLARSVASYESNVGIFMTSQSLLTSLVWWYGHTETWHGMVFESWQLLPPVLLRPCLNRFLKSPDNRPYVI
jgi:hypothetical protein